MLSRKLKAIAIVIILFMSSVVVLSMIDVGSPFDSGKVKVVTTFYPLYYFTSQIAGEHASVDMLIPDNTEPHSWGPTASDMISVSKADVFIYNGAGFEPWAGEFIDQLPSGSVIVDTSKNVGLVLTEEIEELYTSAEGYLASGPYYQVISANATNGQTLPVLQCASGCYNVTLSGSSSYDGSFSFETSLAGDYRLFFDRAVQVSITYPNGTAVPLEAIIGQTSGHEELPMAIFLEIGVENVTINITGSTSDLVHMMVAMASTTSEEEHEHGLNDPHFWIDPLSAKVQVDNILAGLVQADPSNATYYRANADNLKSRLDQLDHDYLTGLANRTKNDIITTHEGFNYLANRYGFNDHAAIGISGDAMPSAQDLVRLTNLVNDLGLHYVFSEPIFNDLVIQQISSTTGAQVLVLDGAHGRAGIHKGMDYFEIMYANLEALQIGLEVK